jgi:hypothetical protein
VVEAWNPAHASIDRHLAACSITGVLTKEVDMPRALFALLVTILAGPALAEPRIDATTQATFNASLAAMRQELSASKATELDTAINMLPFAGMQSVKDIPPSGTLKLDIKTLDGMTANQIVELANKTVTVKIRVGPPPGLPEKYKVKLRNASGESNKTFTAPALSGTGWDITENTNGILSHEHVVLRDGGVLDDGAGHPGRWEQLGARVKLAFNDDFAVYLGTIDEPTSLKGTAANIEGVEWTWTARRSD